MFPTSVTLPTFAGMQNGGWMQKADARVENVGNVHYVFHVPGMQNGVWMQNADAQLPRFLRIVRMEGSAHMVSITWHTKNTPPKQPFCHTHLVVPCAYGI